MKAHRVVREDPYYWLRDRDNPQVISYLEAENTHTESVMAATAGLQETLYQEMIGRLEEDDESAPYPEGEYIYYSRAIPGKDYRVYCRRKTTADGGLQEEELYFDANLMAEGMTYFDMGIFEVSPDGRWLAYSYDDTGDEAFTLHFRDLTTGEDKPWRYWDVSSDGEWTPDSRYFFFTTDDDIKRTDKLHRVDLQSEQGLSSVVYEEPDDRFNVGLELSQDRQYLFAVSVSKQTSEVHYLTTSTPLEDFCCLFPRRENIRYYAEHHKGRFLIRTNENAPRFRLLGISAALPDLAQAETLWESSEDIDLEEVMVLEDYLLFLERLHGQPQIRVRDLVRQREYLLETPDTVYDIEPYENTFYVTDVFAFRYSSPIRPECIYHQNLLSGERTLVKKSRIPRGHNPEDYQVNRKWVTARDGVSVPMTLIYRKDVPLDGSAPCLLYGYGAYGDTEEGHFSRSRLSYLERGFVYAIAHVRGGGQLGEPWYDAGKLMQKWNTFHDFIDCAEFLLAQHYTSRSKLAIEGASAGGLLLGTVLNERPELFKAAVAAVPFVDVVTTMSDPTIPLTTFEYEEWGHPEEAEAFHYMLSYSPYDNVREQEYPALLVMAGLNDPRVQYWEPAKWVARLREKKADHNILLLKTHMEAGHTGTTGRYSYLREIAFEQAFIIWQVTNQ